MGVGSQRGVVRLMGAGSVKNLDRDEFEGDSPGALKVRSDRGKEGLMPLRASEAQCVNGAQAGGGRMSERTLAAGREARVGGRMGEIDGK